MLSIVVVMEQLGGLDYMKKLEMLENPEEHVVSIHNFVSILDAIRSDVVRPFIFRVGEQIYYIDKEGTIRNVHQMISESRYI